MKIFIVIFLLLSLRQTLASRDSLQTNTDIIKVTLLGTGTPPPLMERFGPSTIVQAGVETLLFDAGRGCLQRLFQLKIGYDKLTSLFLTHLHSDHIVGLPDLWLTGWLVSQRKAPLKIFGPEGTSLMISKLEEAYAYDIKIRIEDDHAALEGSKLFTKDIKEGVVYENNGVKVTAFLVDHYPVVPAFGYRVDYKGHSVVISGDTRYSENLIKFAKGVDLLVHEVVVASDTIKESDPKYHIYAHHTNVEQAARLFNLVKPKFAAYSHIAKLHGRTEQELFTRTKAIYAGPFVIGEDLMSFTISDSVSITTWKEKK